MNDTVTLIANLALTLSFVVGLIFGIAQVRAGKKDRHERITLEALNNFQTREFAALIHFINDNKLPLTSAEFRVSPAEDQINFIQFGQQMESLGILVAEKLIDLDLVDKTLGSFVTTTWEKYKPLYLDIREKTSDPFLGEYFQWLAELIDKRMKEQPRKPFYVEH